MTVAYSAGVFLGTDETTGVTIANNATTTSSEIDMFGNNTSEGWIRLYIKFTSTVTAGTMDMQLYSSRVTGQPYADQAPVIGSYAPINGTQKIQVQDFKLTRFQNQATKNNATGANATNVTVGYNQTLES
jgi:hypothetical protein